MCLRHLGPLYISMGAALSRARRLRTSYRPPGEYYSLYPNYETLFRLRFDAAKQAAQKRGEVIPSLVYNLIPASVIRSFAVAIDPFWKFRLGATRVSGTTRTRKRTIRSVLSDRSLVTGRILRGDNFGIYTIGSPQHPICTSYTSSSDFSSSGTSARPRGVPDYLKETKDSTGRTRTPLGSRHNEFFSQSISKWHSPGRRTQYGSTQTSIAFIPACGSSEKNVTKDIRYSQDVGDAATLSDSTIQAIFATEKGILESEMPDRALKLLPKALPDRREYTLFRNLVELRDLPRGIATLRATVGDLVKLFKELPPGLADKVFSLTTPLRNIPSEYVSYNFGWKQLDKDLKDLLKAPERITKKVNYLLQRKARPTTFRAKSIVTLDGGTGPSFDYNVHQGENWWESGAQSVSTLVTRTAEFRVAINAIFDFPTLAVPELQQKELLRRFGVSPTPTDIYNLIPWTWLVDWFTGLGNYIEAIDAINSDRSTINMGFITGVLTSDYTCSLSSKTTMTDGYVYSPPVGTSGGTRVTTSNNLHTSILQVKTQIRKELSSAYDVVPLLAGGTLSPYQQSILGALIAMRSRNLR
jgi:hypothetical protein